VGEEENEKEEEEEVEERGGDYDDDDDGGDGDDEVTRCINNIAATYSRNTSCRHLLARVLTTLSKTPQQ
jgi:hypothetical protein